MFHNECNIDLAKIIGPNIQVDDGALQYGSFFACKTRFSGYCSSRHNHALPFVAR